jgi:FkbM family methyltransferase
MQVIKEVREALRWFYRRRFGWFMIEREKASLRQKVKTLSIRSDYPFDPEAKLLSCIGIESPMLDIGANTGIYSAILEPLVGSDNMYLFEPLPDLYQYLKWRFAKAHVFNVAISSEEGRQIIRVPYIEGRRYYTRASLNAHVEPDQTAVDEIMIQSLTLDNVVKTLGLQKVGFIKVDVEGHEFHVITSGIETLTRFRPLVLIEIEARHHMFSIERIFRLFAGIGYRGYYVNPETCMLLCIDQFDCSRDQKQEYLKSRKFSRYLNNFLFVHESSADEFVSKTVAFLESEKRCSTWPRLEDRIQ